MLEQHFLWCVPENTGSSGDLGPQRICDFSGLELGICIQALFGNLWYHSLRMVWSSLKLTHLPGFILKRSILFSPENIFHGKWENVAESFVQRWKSIVYMIFFEIKLQFQPGPMLNNFKSNMMGDASVSSMWLQGKPAENIYRGFWRDKGRLNSTDSLSVKSMIY